jgi:prolyl-tRNA editing enzyme YbaK/EbsC (Cys-tRNA(Pro) deacylase)
VRGRGLAGCRRLACRSGGRRADEFVATAEAEGLLGWHVGEVIPTGVYTNAQMGEPAFGRQGSSRTSAWT